MRRFYPVSEREVIICRDVNELNRKGAQQFIALAGEAISQTGRFSVALSGGSTPKGLYASLATPEYRNRVDWTRVHLFWGDERCVPPDHPESNFRMVQESLLSKIQIPFENVHRMMGEKEPEQALRSIIARSQMVRLLTALMGCSYLIFASCWRICSLDARFL
jgi:6-phosphogluconolactonase